MWEIGETCDNRGPALPPAPDFGSRLKPNILLLWRPNSRRRRRRRRRRGDPASPPLETPSCCCSTRSQPPLVSNHVGPDQSRLVLPTSFCLFVLFVCLYYYYVICFKPRGPLPIKASAPPVLKINFSAPIDFGSATFFMKPSLTKLWSLVLGSLVSDVFLFSIYGSAGNLLKFCSRVST